MSLPVTRDHWAEIIDKPVSGVIQQLKAEGWKVVSLRPGDLSEIVLNRKSKNITLIAQNNCIGTVHVFDTVNH
ncbi:MAG TPA: hypothetical protein VEK08_16755 [Planctomycetota bacterium]|nr:hypothetical protein [Planctomycetota bacterium]